MDEKSKKLFEDCIKGGVNITHQPIFIVEMADGSTEITFVESGSRNEYIVRVPMGKDIECREDDILSLKLFSCIDLIRLIRDFKENKRNLFYILLEHLKEHPLST